MTRRRKGNRRGKRSAWYDRKYSVAQIAQKALNGVKSIRKVINVERKYVDVALANTAIGLANSIVLVNGITQGDTEQLREGNSVLMQSLYYEFMFTGSAASATNTIRFMIVLDKQQRPDTVPTVTDILETDSFWTLYNHDTVPSRYTILHDKHYHMDVSVGKHVVTGSDTIPVNKHILFNGVNSTDIQKNGIYYLISSSDGATSPTARLNFRVNYTDN